MNEMSDTYRNLERSQTMSFKEYIAAMRELSARQRWLRSIHRELNKYNRMRSRAEDMVSAAKSQKSVIVSMMARYNELFDEKQEVKQ